MKLISTLILALFLSFSACTKKSSEESQNHAKNQEEGPINAQDLAVDERGLSKAFVTLKTAHGNIVFNFYPEKAPITVTRIMHLIQEGFYDGLTFHRVVPNFVIQGGDPQGTGRGGSGKNLPAEFNDIPHIRGSVAMARAQDINSADSQFYIALGTLPHLDGSYTVFGQVSEGLDILDKVVRGDKILSMTLTIP